MKCVLLNYYTNHCTYIKFTHLNIKNAPTCFGPKTIMIVLGPKHVGAFLMF